MNFRSPASFVLVFLTVTLSGCFATAAKMLPDGTWGIATTVGDGWDRSTTFVGEYECPVKEGRPIIGQCKKSASAQAPDRVHGQTVAGQVAVGVMGGTGAAVINGNTARSVAEKQCSGGGCGAGGAGASNVTTTSVSVNIVGACAASGTCGQ